MNMRISGNGRQRVDTIVSQLKPEPHKSDQRRRYLEKVARILGAKDYSVTLTGSVKTADVHMGMKRVRVSNKDFEQPVTDLPQDEYYLVRQEAHLTHELGHVKYTSDSWSELPSVPAEGTPEFRAYKTIWNYLEDGAIEKFLRLDYSCSRELRIKNANMNYLDDEELTRRARRVTAYDAVASVVFDLAKHNTGLTQKMLDSNREVMGEDLSKLIRDKLPEMKDDIEAIMNERDANARNELIAEFWNDHMHTLYMRSDSRSSMGAPDWLTFLGVKRVQGGQEQEAPEGPDTVIALTGLDGFGGGEEIDLDDDTEVIEMEAPEALKQELEEEFDEEDFKGQKQQVEAEQHATEVDETEVEEFIEAVEASDAHEIDSSPAGSWDTDSQQRYQQASNLGQKLERTLREELRQEKRKDTRRRQRSGEFDSSRMMAASRGETDVFEKRAPGNEKEYACTVVVDRSSSMGSSKYSDEPGDINPAEVAVGAMTMALEEVGIPTTVLDLHGDTTKLAKLSEQDTAEARQQMFSGDTKGQTPISQSISVALELVRNKTNGFVLVVTDGGADEEDKYEKVIENATRPVVGVGIGSNTAAEKFHAYREVQNVDDLRANLRKLVEEVMF